MRARSRVVAMQLQDADLALLVDEVDALATVPRQPAARVPPRPRAGVPKDPAYLLVTMTAAARGDYECRSSLLTAGAKAAVLSGSVALRHAELLQLIEPLEMGAATTRDLARIGTCLLYTSPSPRD